MPGKLDFIAQELSSLRERGLFIDIRVVDSPQGAWITVDGRRVLNLCSNNYLGLADHDVLKRRAREAIQSLGVGPAAVRTTAGTLSIHLDLEARWPASRGWRRR